MSYDVLVIGGGPAGLSASINVRARGRSALVVSNPLEENPLWRAEKVDNYLGLPGLSGAEMLAAMRRHAEQAGVEFLAGKVLNAVQMPDAWYVSVGPDMYNARAVVLAAGVARGKKFAGRGGASGPGRQLLRHLRRDALPGQAGGGGGIHRHRPAGGGVSPENRLLRDLFRPPQAVRDPGRRPGGGPSPATAGPFRRRACSSCGPPWPPRSCSRGWRWNRAM